MKETRPAGRPSAPVLLTADVDEGHARTRLEVLEAEKMWILLYQNRPVALRTLYATPQGMKFKYPRTGYNNRPHALRLALQLNERFDCEDFSVGLAQC